LRNNRKNESFSSAWESAPSSTSAWATTAAETSRLANEPVATIQSAAVAASYDNSEFIKYKAVYEFSGRNNDEITFQPGDIIMV
jgi:hypothetical protein